MRTKFFTIMALAAFCCLSCSKEDEVDIEKMAGRWFWIVPTLIEPWMSPYVIYTFTEDETYTKLSYEHGVPSNSGTYMVSVREGRKVLSLYDSEECIEQYYILKLNSEEIILESTDENEYIREKKLIKNLSWYNEI